MFTVKEQGGVTDCCGAHEKQTESLKWRACALTFIGALSLLPPVEVILTTGVFGTVLSGLILCFILYCIIEDFKHEHPFILGVTMGLLLLISTSFMASSATASLCFGTGFVLCITSLLVDLKKNQQNTISLVPSMPSTQKIILLLVLLNSLITIGSIIFPGTTMFAFTLHEPLFILGSYHLSTWLKQSMQKPDIVHNGRYTYVKQILNDNEERDIQLSELKKDMTLKIEKVQLPVGSIALDDKCEVEDTASEGRSIHEKGSIIPPNTTIYSGRVRCTEDFAAVTHSAHSQQAKENNPRLNLFLMGTLITALLAGCWSGLASHSITTALNTFCLNLIVSCPCVFFTMTPILMLTLGSWLKNHYPEATFNKMPQSGKPHFMVFDRTHTLYTTNVEDHKGDYICSGENRAMVESLKTQGIECVILSGHSTNNWEQHLKSCKENFEGIIKNENIIFNPNYHGEDSRKKEVIRNLQIYGSIKKPDSFLEWIYAQLRAVFWTYTVGMAGDGNNDVAALQQADLSIGVCANNENLNQSVDQAANFSVQQKDLYQLPKLIQGIQHTHTHSEQGLYAALLFNIFMLLMVNGLCFGISVSTATACTTMSVFCPLMLLFAMQMSIPAPKSTPTPAANLPAKKPAPTPAHANPPKGGGSVLPLRSMRANDTQPNTSPTFFGNRPICGECENAANYTEFNNGNTKQQRPICTHPGCNKCHP